jgi:RNA polymerase sigma-70 factor (ECF subfamily)
MRGMGQSSLQAPNLTQLLNDARLGNREAEARVFALVMRELRAKAAAYLRRERAGHTLQPTALVNEAYIKLARYQRVSWQNRAQFFGTASRVMRRILVDHARARDTDKRGGGVIHLNVALQSPIAETPEDASTILALDEALTRLARVEPRQTRVVECRFFGGLDVEQTARTLGISPTTVKREWQQARAWLFAELTQT